MAELKGLNEVDVTVSIADLLNVAGVRTPPPLSDIDMLNNTQVTLTGAELAALTPAPAPMVTSKEINNTMHAAMGLGPELDGPKQP